VLNCRKPNCGKTFWNERARKRPRKNEHEANEVRRCQVYGCDKTFKSQSGLYQHVRNKHETFVGKPPHRLPCPMCPKVFRSPAERDAHETIHHEVDGYKCVVCNARQSDKQSLICHYDMCRIQPDPYLNLGISQNAFPSHFQMPSSSSVFYQQSEPNFQAILPNSIQNQHYGTMWQSQSQSPTNSHHCNKGRIMLFS
jgi:hypothetical protein